MDRNKIKQSIKDDILNNIDCIVDSIIDSMDDDGDFQLPSKQDVVEVIKIIKETETEEEKEQLNYFLGKERIPDPIRHEDGSVDVYTEIDVDSICDKIKLANDVFTHLYKFSFLNSYDKDTIPDDIKQVLGVYETSLLYERKGVSDKRDSSRKWLMGVALVGILRYRKLANKPYMLDNDIEKSIKEFFKNLENIYNVLLGNKIMVDPKDKGFHLWDTTKSHNKGISFRKSINKND